jgi:hypothetical protein
MLNAYVYCTLDKRNTVKLNGGNKERDSGSLTMAR